MTFSILLYHEIGPSPRPSANLDCFCHTSQFRDQMHLLSSAGVSVRLANELYEAITRGESLAQNTVALTFDDADVSFLRYAQPILEEFGFPSTVFAVVGKLGGTADWVRNPQNAIPLMSLQELRSLPQSLVEIGSHSMTHRKLPELSTEQALSDLQNSKLMLDDLLDREIHSFAYPHGCYNSQTMQLVEKVGYHTAYTTDGHRRINGQTDRFCIPRQYVTYSDTIQSFAVKVGLG